jgi:hypothetical protein
MHPIGAYCDALRVEYLPRSPSNRNPGAGPRLLALELAR